MKSRYWAPLSVLFVCLLLGGCLPSFTGQRPAGGPSKTPAAVPTSPGGVTGQHNAPAPEGTEQYEPEPVPEPEQNEEQALPDKKGENNEQAKQKPAKAVVTKAELIAVGDIMVHMPQLPGAYDSKHKRYRFDHFFKEVKPVLEQGDWSMANLEAPIGGKALGYSGFPRFNAPSEMAEALKKAGFNIVTNANNHALDRGFAGVERTLVHLQKQGLITKGTARSAAEAAKLTIIERQKIKMGLLAYTYGTNGIPLPKNKPYTVSLINENAMISDIAKLRKAGADFITIALHFGIEYETKPNEAQKQLARKLIAAGADIVAGSHPHVVQPFEICEVTAADGTTRRGVIIYSMGNFISNQRGDLKDYGVIFKVAIEKNHTAGRTTIGSVTAIPTWVHRYKLHGLYRYSILPLEQSIAKRSIPAFPSSGYSTLQHQLNRLNKRLHSMSAQPVQLAAQ
ncbi:CapA family protein [Paenibacillus sp. GCM10027626]|uniref:CapA family protein n=1 Tax=Paenibacillus sp. GCM10027626 TaxID=3273411 RepID=UPI00362B3A86